MKLPKMLTDPDCKGCQKRKRLLIGLVAKGKEKARKARTAGSNAARRIISRRHE